MDKVLANEMRAEILRHSAHTLLLVPPFLQLPAWSTGLMASAPAAVLDCTVASKMKATIRGRREE